MSTILLSNLTRWLRVHRYFCVVLVMFVVGTLVHQSLLPVMEGYDETLHYSYIAYLRIHHTLPDRRLQATNTTAQESSQAPFAYWFSAAVMDVLRLPTNIGGLTELIPVRNRWMTPPDDRHTRDNLNVYYHGPNEQAIEQIMPEIVTANHVGRLVSLFWGIIAVIATYSAALEIFASGNVDHKNPGTSAWATAAAAFYAFTPEMIHISSTVSNDITATAFGALITWQALVILRGKTSPLRLIVFGILIGLCGLSKVNALLIVPAAAAAVLLVWKRQRLQQGSWLQLIKNSLLVIIPFVLLFGTWVAYGIVNYGSPLGLEAHSVFENDAVHPSLVQYAAGTIPVYLSYWGRLGAGTAWLPTSTYLFYTILLGLAIVGYIGYYRIYRHLAVNPVQADQLMVLGLVALLFIAGLGYWLYKLFAIYLGIHGRLIYPAHTAITILICVGLYYLSRLLGSRWSQVIRLSIVLGTAVSGLLAAPTVLYAAYSGPIMLTRDQLPALQGSPIDYDGAIRLRGYQQKMPYLRENSFPQITLCWEVLKPTTKEAILAVKVLDNVTGTYIGNRTTIPGLGHYNSFMWHPGAIFCDDVDVVMQQKPEPGRVYDIVAVILDWKATTPAGDPIELPRIAHLISPAGDMRSPIADIQGSAWKHTGVVFPNFASLDQVAVEGSAAPGQSITVKVLWKVTGATSNNWSQFFHLLGPDNYEISIADKIPRNGLYPTWAWQPGEYITDSWVLPIPADLKPGTYSVATGFYRQDTGERVPVSVDGTPQPNGEASLLTFAVKP